MEYTGYTSYAPNVPVMEQERQQGIGNDPSISGGYSEVTPITGVVVLNHQFRRGLTMTIIHGGMKHHILPYQLKSDYVLIYLKQN